MRSLRRWIISQFACVSRATLSRICLSALAVSTSSFLLLTFKRLSVNSASGVIAFKIVFLDFLHLEVTASGLWSYFGSDLTFGPGLTLATTRFSQFWDSSICSACPWTSLHWVYFLPSYSTWLPICRQQANRIDRPDYEPVLYRTKYPLHHLRNIWRLFHLSNIQYPYSPGH